MAFVLMPLGFIYAFFTFGIDVSKYFKSVAISIDQHGNVVLAPIMNDILIKKAGYKFGNPDETISAVLGHNKKNGTLLFLGKWIADILNKIEKNHVEMAARIL